MKIITSSKIAKIIGERPLPPPLKTRKLSPLQLQQQKKQQQADNATDQFLRDRGVQIDQNNQQGLSLAPSKNYFNNKSKQDINQPFVGKSHQQLIQPIYDPTKRKIQTQNDRDAKLGDLDSYKLRAKIGYDKLFSGKKNQLSLNDKGYIIFDKIINTSRPMLGGSRNYSNDIKRILNKLNSSVGTKQDKEDQSVFGILKAIDGFQYDPNISYEQNQKKFHTYCNFKISQEMTSRQQGYASMIPSDQMLFNKVKKFLQRSGNPVSDEQVKYYIEKFQSDKAYKYYQNFIKNNPDRQPTQKQIDSFRYNAKLALKKKFMVRPQQIFVDQSALSDEEGNQYNQPQAKVRNPFQDTDTQYHRQHSGLIFDSVNKAIKDLPDGMLGKKIMQQQMKDYGAQAVMGKDSRPKEQIAAKLKLNPKQYHNARQTAHLHMIENLQNNKQFYNAFPSYFQNNKLLKQRQRRLQKNKKMKTKTSPLSPSTQKLIGGLSRSSSVYNNWYKEAQLKAIKKPAIGTGYIFNQQQSQAPKSQLQKQKILLNLLFNKPQAPTREIRQLGIDINLLQKIYPRLTAEDLQLIFGDRLSNWHAKTYPQLSYLGNGIFDMQINKTLSKVNHYNDIKKQKQNINNILTNIKDPLEKISVKRQISKILSLVRPQFDKFISKTGIGQYLKKQVDDRFSQQNTIDMKQQQKFNLYKNIKLQTLKDPEISNLIKQQQAKSSQAKLSLSGQAFIKVQDLKNTSQIQQNLTTLMFQARQAGGGTLNRISNICQTLLDLLDSYKYIQVAGLSYINQRIDNLITQVGSQFGGKVRNRDMKLKDPAMQDTALQTMSDITSVIDSAMKGNTPIVMGYQLQQTQGYGQCLTHDIIQSDILNIVDKQQQSVDKSKTQKSRLSSQTRNMNYPHGIQGNHKLRQQNQQTPIEKNKSYLTRQDAARNFSAPKILSQDEEKFNNNNQVGLSYEQPQYGSRLPEPHEFPYRPQVQPLEDQNFHQKKRKQHDILKQKSIKQKQDRMQQYNNYGAFGS